MTRRRTHAGDLAAMLAQISRQRSRLNPDGTRFCNCPAEDDPCGLYPMGNRRGRSGKCEGCAMGLHRGHTIPRSA